MSGLLQANALENQAILDKGLELNLANGGHIVTIQFFDQFINVTGAGITIGLVVYMVAFAKSKQLKFLDVLKWFQPSLISMSRCSLVCRL